MTLADDRMHPVYLPFSEAEVREHFRYQGSDPSGDRLAYRRVENDARLWTVARLMALYHRPGRKGRVLAFAALLRTAGLVPPAGFDDWSAALAGPLHLYFDVALPAPCEYGAWLLEDLDTRAVLSHVRQAAGRADRGEGLTHADAILLAPDTGVAVMFEAKAVSEISGQVTSACAGNTLARYLDVLRDEPVATGPMAARRPERSYLMLVLPEHFGSHEPGELRGVANRVGWAAWDQLDQIVPSTCGPLPTSIPA